MRRCSACNSFFDDSVALCPYDGQALEAVQVGKKAARLEGTTFANRYTIQRRIGEGGMGMVYEALDTRKNNLTVAIKVLHRDVCNDEKAVRRFFSEARVLSSISHPNVIELYDFGRSDDKRLYISMEMLDLKKGRPADVLIKHKALSVLDALHILDQIAAGLGEAHLQGVIHRDLKPANIFVCRNPDKSLFVTVLDFGIAKISGGQNLTVSGKVMGTPSYMAPEQIMGKPPDPRTDIYALGAMAYELISGRPPFVSDTPLTLLYSHLNDVPPALSEVAPDLVGQTLSDQLSTLLAKSPEERPRNTVELRQMIAPYLQNPDLIMSGAGAVAPGPEANNPPAKEFDLGVQAPGEVSDAAPPEQEAASEGAGLWLWGVIIVCAVLAALALAVIVYFGYDYMTRGQSALELLEMSAGLLTPALNCAEAGGALASLETTSSVC